MSAHRFRRVDRRTAEQLLSGAPAPEREDALSALLAAASAPARADELAGEQAALAAFRAARLADSPQSRRPSMLKVTLAKLVTVKIAATATAVLVAGGVAVAAATGSLPMQGGDNPPVSPSVPSTTDQVSSSSTASGDAPGKSGNNADNGKHNGQNPNEDKNKGGDKAATPSPSLVGLCHAYSAGSKAEQGKALENPAFSYLITTAGGKDKVAAYCTELLAKEPKQQPTHPTGKPTENPGNKPTDPPANDNANGGRQGQTPGN